MPTEAEAAEPVAIDRWLHETRGISKDEFARRYPHPFLVLFLVASRGAERRPLAFATELAAESGESPAGISVVALVKAPGSPYADRISIGRARNCDAVIRHKSVSKLHAHLRIAPNGGVTLTDLGSRVGTFVDTERLARDVPTSVRPGAHVRFGSVAGNVFDAPALWSALGRLGGGRR